MTVCGSQVLGSTNTQTWRGCVGTRIYPLDVRDASHSTPIPGLMNTSCPSEITPLTNARSTLTDRIEALTTTGETYIPAGSFWGWAMLWNTAPLDEAVPDGTRHGGRIVRQGIVLMTDGHNTRSPDYPYHWGSDTTRANELTTELCANIKAQQIEVFTVAFAVTDTAIKDVLRGCATAASTDFDAGDRAQFEMASGTIARDMTALHLAR